MIHFRHKHFRHLIRFRPHPLPDLRCAGQSCLNADIDVPIFIRTHPRLVADVRFWNHRASLHAGMDFVPGPIQKPGVDKDDARLRLADAFLEVDGGAPLLVHNPDFHGIRREPKCALYPLK